MEVSLTPTTGDDKRRSVLSSFMQRLLPLIRIAIGVSLIATVATSFASYHWLAEILANLRIQQCLALIGLSFVCLVVRRWTFVAVTCVCLASHLPWLLAALPKNGEIEKDAMPMTITLANVLTSNERHADIIADVLSQNPDAFVILELSSSLANSISLQTSAAYPHSIVRPQDASNFGIGMYSRHPIEQSQVLTFGSEIESLSASIRLPGDSLQIFATHPIPPIGEFHARLRNDHLEQLATMIQQVKSKDSTTPIVLVGDLNLTPWSPYFSKLEARSGLRRANSRLNVTPTWYRYPFFPFGLVLDHALISDGLNCVAHVVGGDIGSDHRTVSVKLVPAE